MLIHFHGHLFQRCPVSDEVYNVNFPIKNVLSFLWVYVAIIIEGWFLKARSHCAFFFWWRLLIPLIVTNGLHKTRWKCSHYATCDNITNSTVSHYEQKQIAVANHTVWTDPNRHDRQTLVISCLKISMCICSILFASHTNLFQLFINK